MKAGWVTPAGCKTVTAGRFNFPRPPPSPQGGGNGCESGPPGHGSKEWTLFGVKELRARRPTSYDARWTRPQSPAPRAIALRPGRASGAPGGGPYGRWTARLGRSGGPLRPAGAGGHRIHDGARFVHDQLELAGWEVAIADAVKVKGLAPSACRTDKIDAWVLAELSRRDLIPAIWLPDPGVRAERERARWRLQLVHHRTALKNRIHSTLMTFGHPCPVSDLFGVWAAASCWRPWPCRNPGWAR